MNESVCRHGGARAKGYAMYGPAPDVSNLSAVIPINYILALIRRS